MRRAMKTGKECPRCGDWIKPERQSHSCGWTSGFEDDAGAKAKRKCSVSSCPLVGLPWHTYNSRGDVTMTQYRCHAHHHSEGSTAEEVDAVSKKIRRRWSMGREGTLRKLQRDSLENLLQTKIDALGLSKGPGECAEHFVRRCQEVVPEDWLKNILKPTREA